jgi:hypothetical protein
MVPKFCMGSLLTKIEGFQPKQIFGEPPWSPGGDFRFFKVFSENIELELVRVLTLYSGLRTKKILTPQKLSIRDQIKLENCSS